MTKEPLNVLKVALKCMLQIDFVGELCTWDLRTRQIKQTLDIHSGSVLGVTACGDLMVTHGRDSAVNIWKKEHTTLEKSG